MSKEKIISSILGDALRLAENLRNDAKQRADELILAAQDDAAQIRAEAKVEVERHHEEAAKSGLLSAQLDLNKRRLALKQKYLSLSFGQALEEAVSLPQREYLALVAGLLKSAEEGDTVIVSKKDKDVITQDFLDKNGKCKLTLSKTHGDFKGGIKLVNKDYEQNLTFEFLLETLRGQTEREIAAILFGGQNE